MAGYTQIKSDGTIRSYDDATAWDDMVGDLFGKRLFSTTGKVDYDYDENCLVFQSGGTLLSANDRVGSNLQIAHAARVGSNIEFRPHLHWFQEVTSGTVDAFTMTMRYRLQRNDEAKSTSWVTVTLHSGTDDVFDFTGEVDGIYNQISEFPTIKLTCNISDTFQVQMARTDSNGGEMNVYFMDMHYEIDSFGSDDEFSKTT